MSFFKGKDFTSCKKMTDPVYAAPSCIREMLDIAKVYEDGIFEIETDGGKNRPRLFDKVYEFSDINYINKDNREKEQVCLSFCKFLNSMNVDFKLHVVNEPRNMEEVREKVLIPEKEGQEEGVRELLEANNRLIEKALERGEPQIHKKKYLTVTCRRKSYKDARAYFNVLEAAIYPVFQAMRSKLVELDTQKRLEVLYHYFHDDGIPDFSWTELKKSGRDWKNELVPYSLNNEVRRLDFGEECMQILFVPRLPSSLDESKVLSGLSEVSFFSSVTIDCACIPRSILKEKLEALNLNNEVSINQELQLNARNKNFSSGPSYQKSKKKEELEDYMDQIDDNDENGFFMQMLVAVRGKNQKDLAENVETMKLIGAGMGIHFVIDYNQQIQALNTLLPIGARRVDHMRAMLTSSMVAFQPFHAKDYIQPGGTFFGTNKLTKNIIMLDRKKMKNSNACFFGHSGSGKSMMLKLTEIGQAYVATDDDIFMIDPQNEMEMVTQKFGGQFFDLTASSGIYLNPFEVPEEVMYAVDSKVQAQFIGKKADFVEDFVYSCLKGTIPTGVHKTLIVRCIKKLYDQVFQMKKLKSPVLGDFRQILMEQQEPEARDLYAALEAYTDGTFDMFARDSNLNINNRMVVFGMKNVPNTMWETCMITVMHLLSMRMDYNTSLQKATHFICDEAQYVCRNSSSADQMLRAFITYRKYGGICTACFQNISAILANPDVKDMVSNCDLKVLLDQGGSDRNALSSILELSSTEFQELANPEPGQCLIVYNNQILQCNAYIDPENPLYALYSTNFHERAEEAKKKEALNEDFTEERVTAS